MLEFITLYNSENLREFFQDGKLLIKTILLTWNKNIIYIGKPHKENDYCSSNKTFKIHIFDS